MTLKERFKAEPSRIGKFFKEWVAYTLLIATGLDQCLELASILPEDWIPMWVKTTLVIGSIVARVGGNLTVKKHDRDTSIRTTKSANSNRSVVRHKGSQSGEEG